MGGATLSLFASAGGGASPVTIRIDPAYIADVQSTPTLAEAQFQLNSNGFAYQSISGGSPVLLYQWCTPAAEATNYEAFATLVSGALSGGSSAVSTWLPLSTSRSWRVRTTSGVALAYLNIGIRRIGTTPITAADIEMYAEST
jgi:hypothetical protein